MYYAKPPTWGLDSLDQKSSTSSRPLSSATQDSDSSNSSRDQRRRYMRKLRKLIDRLGYKRKGDMCYQAIRSSLVFDEEVLEHSEEYDDHDSKCNCHEFFAELELAMAQSHLHARKRQAVVLSSHARAFSGTPDQFSGFPYAETSNHTTSKIDGFQSSPSHKNSASATERHTAGKPAVNRWQLDSRNSSASFDFLENSASRKIRSPNETNHHPETRSNMSSLETQDYDVWVKEEYAYSIHLNSPPNLMTVSSFI